MDKLKPSLLLLPNVLDEGAAHELFFPPSVQAAVETLDGLIAESFKGGRHFLRRFSFPHPKTFSQIPIQLLNEHTKEDEIDPLLEPIKKGQRWGLVSDGGLVCLADPGAKLVMRARKLGLSVEAFIGPSSIVLALMLSGLPAQSFAFHGYLEKEVDLLEKQIKMLEMRSSKEKSTQLFIETPYRNQKMLDILLKTLTDSTLLCIASDLTAPGQIVLCQSVKTWKKIPLPNLKDKPTVFLFHSDLN